MENTAIVRMTPVAETSGGFMQIKEKYEGVILRFLPDPDFRGKLSSVSWFQEGKLLGQLTKEDPEFSVFEQTGRRPEIRVPGRWFDDKLFTRTGALTIRFTFSTLRQESIWYAHLYIKLPAQDGEASYLIPKPTKPQAPDYFMPGNDCCCSNNKPPVHGCDHEEVSEDDILDLFNSDEVQEDDLLDLFSK